MASVYKLKRKSPKIHENTELTPKELPSVEPVVEQNDAPAEKISSDGIFDTLSVPKADSGKLEEIFGSNASKEGYDKTADLLKGVYADRRSSVGKADLSELKPTDKEDLSEEKPAVAENSYDEEFIANLGKEKKEKELPLEIIEVEPDPAPVAEVSEEKAEEAAQEAPEQQEEPEAKPEKEDPADPEKLLEALAVPKVDAEKLEEVLNASRKGVVGLDSSKEEYDETADLLREIFGGEHAPARKSQAVEPEGTEANTEENAAESIAEATEEKADDSEYIADHGSDADKTIDYIAIHDGESEKTIEYGSLVNGADGQTTPPLAEELQVSKEPITDDPYNTTYEDADTKYERKPILPEEFTSPEEYDEFSEHLRNKNYRCLSSLLWTFLIFLVGLYIESATFSKLYHPEILKPGGVYNVIYLLVDLQFVFFSALLSLPSVLGGVKALFKGKPDRNTVLFILHLFTALHAIVLLSCGAKEYPLFGCVASFFAFLNSFANFLDAKRIYRTFRICGTKGDKVVAKPLSSDSPEAEAFREELEGDPHFFSIQKTAFVDKFFARTAEQGKAERSFAWVTMLSILFSVVFAALSYVKNPDIASTASSFITMMVMTLPLSCVFSISLPFAHMAAKSEKLGSAIISLSAAEEYASADVVSFTDKEIFPPKSVKITTIRTYGQTRIDKAILYSAMIFQKLGGPLSEVFKKTISGVVQEISEDFEFNEITADGMCANIDGQDIYVGNKNYLLSYDFGYTRDEQDREFEAKQGKIMYMVIGNELAAKFYLRYSISKQFKKTVLSLFRSGICPAVKTCDPNFDSNLFRALLQNKRIPAAIIKSCEAMKDAPVVERSDSGIVCVTSIAKLLRTFSFCEGLRKVTRTNVATKIFSALVGLGVVGFLFFFGGLTKVTAMFVLIYQLLWLIPVIIPSLTE